MTIGLFGSSEEESVKKVLAVVAVAASIFVAAPAAQANQCQDIIEGWCALTQKHCDIGAALQEKYGVGWYCLD